MQLESYDSVTVEYVLVSSYLVWWN